MVIPILLPTTKACLRIEYSVSVMSRRGGWWGVAFVVTLSVGAAMVTLPTATQSGPAISAFYAAHATIILIQQILGVVALGFLIAFAVALGARRRRWLMIGTVLLAITELATNIPPAVLALTNIGPDSAHALTVFEDIADVALSLSIGIFSVAATMGQVPWVQVAGLLVAALSLVRVVMIPSGVRALDAVAPIAFLVLVLILSVRVLLGRGTQTPIGPAHR
jgi:hypothetical protein